MDAESSYSIARLAGDDELDQVAALEAASFSNPGSREALARELEHAHVARVYVAHAADGRVVGFCACWFIVDELHINTLAIEAGHRRRGLATKLLRVVLEEAHAAGME